jgi:hypothetical protein
LYYAFVTLGFNLVFLRIVLRHFFESFLLLQLVQQLVIGRAEGVGSDGQRRAPIITLVQLLQLVRHVGLNRLITAV